MKIGIVMALARFYHGHSAADARWSWKLLIPLTLLVVPVGLVMYQPDLGTGMLILLTGAWTFGSSAWRSSAGSPPYRSPSSSCCTITSDSGS